MLHFLPVMKIIASIEVHVKLSLILKIVDAFMLRDEFDSYILSGTIRSARSDTF